MRAFAASIVTILAGVHAAAAQDYPNIVGTWKGEGLGVERSGDGPADFVDDALTQVVSEQRDRRFTGELHATSGNEPFVKPFVGVFMDETTFLWSEPDGIVQGRLVDENTILSCYAHTTGDALLAACNTLKRQE